MEEKAITPAMVNGITTAPIEEITQLSETVMEATQVGTRATEELTHLSNCLSDFTEVQEKYQKKCAHVRNQMRYLSSHM